MTAIAIIPSRYASTRFPGKSLIDILGKSMIRRVYERVSAVPALDDVIVATDDKRILEHVSSFGGKAVMTSSHHQSGTERCAEVVSRLSPRPEIVINVQGDEPFIAPEHIHDILTCFDDPDTQIATLVKRIDDPATLTDPGIPKVVFDHRRRAIYFSRSPIPYLRDAPQSDWHKIFPYYKHLGIYAYSSDVLEKIVQLSPGELEQAERLEQLRWLENGYSITIKETQTESISIDSPQDVALLLERKKT